MRFRYSFLFTFILVLTLGLAACSNKDKAGTDSSEKKQVLVFARGGDSTSLDFASVSDGESTRVTRQIFETLLDFKKDSFEVVPGLAHDWDIKDDGKRYTFHLEEGVTFHDGTPLNAEAVKTNFERWSDPNHKFAFKDDGYSYLMYGNLFGGFKGEEGHVIKEINVKGDYEIEFVLKRPLGSFLQNMATDYFAITSPAALEKYGAKINKNPVGTGPFKFVSWSKDDAIVLEKNEKYRKDGLPKLNQVIFRVIPENSARLIALRSGEIDIMDGINPIDAKGIESDKDLKLYKRGENNVGFLGFNNSKEPLNNKLVRQAINHSIDKQAIVDALFAGYATPATNPIPPSYMGYNDELVDYKYDPKKAKELLAKAGYKDGFKIDLWVMPVARPYMPDPEKVAEIVQSSLAEVGITVNIVREEWAPYLEKTKRGEQELYLLGGSGVNGDPDYMLRYLLHGDSIGAGNSSFYNNEKVNALLDQGKALVDQDERAKLYKEAQRLILEDSAMVTLVHSIPLAASRSSVKNYVPHPSTGESLAEVELSK
jgi:peptide/nickel transport system substrate-binding protein